MLVAFFATAFGLLDTLAGYLATPLSRRDSRQHRIAGVLLAIGLVLWLVNWLVQRLGGQARTAAE